MIVEFTVRALFTLYDVGLPRGAVTDYLENSDLHVAVRYLEYLIQEKVKMPSVSSNDLNVREPESRLLILGYLQESLLVCWCGLIREKSIPAT